LNEAKKLDEYEEVAMYNHPAKVVFMANRVKDYDRLVNLQGLSSHKGLSAMHKGEMSQQSKAKLRTAVDWLLASAKTKHVYSKKTKKSYPWKLNFMTLTLPTQGTVSDLHVKSILNSWFSYAKYAYGLHSYVWRAEPQMNGNIHFHITSDCWIWKTSLQHSWNRLLRKNNLLNGHDDPPSTKVHATHRVKNMAAYLCKYFSKSSKYKLIRRGARSSWHVLAYSKGQRTWRKIPYSKEKCERIIIGRLWGCSHSLSNIKPFKFTMEKSRATFLHQWFTDAKCREFTTEYVTSYSIPPSYYEEIDDADLRAWFQATCATVRKKKYHDQLELYTEGDEPIPVPEAEEKLLVA
jgi:hypothetical protein